jgi:hypothetical protein
MYRDEIVNGGDVGAEVGVTVVRIVHYKHVSAGMVEWVRE